MPRQQDGGDDEPSVSTLMGLRDIASGKFRRYICVATFALLHPTTIHLLAYFGMRR